MVDKDLLAYLEGFISEERKGRFQKILAGRTTYLTVAIEDVFQMHNTSAVIRSCEVFGIQEVHVIEDRFGKRLDKNIAMGAQRWVDVYRYKDTKECMRHLRDQGYRLIATSPQSNATVLNDFELDRKTALFFGTEKEGLSSDVMAGVDGHLTIPMVGFTESLNISVSAAIILYKLTTDLRRSPRKWQLSPEEQLEKQLDWTKKSIKSLKSILARYHDTSSKTQ